METDMCYECGSHKETASDGLCNFCRVEYAGRVVADLSFAFADLLKVYGYMIDGGDSASATMIFAESAKAINETKKRHFPFGERLPLEIRHFFSA